MSHSIGYSSCPNDTFIFDYMIRTSGVDGSQEWEVHIADVEALNKWASTAELDVTKLSYRAFFEVSEDYYLLRSGGALGRGCGPLLVARSAETDRNPSELHVAIPGEMTTAFFLLKFAFPNISKISTMLFSDIEEAVISGRVDAGLIIHESRFTYESKGLHKIADLGEVWERQTGAPIPLGCIACKKSLGIETARAIEKSIRDSLLEARKNPAAAMPYVRAHAQEMEDAVMQKHIDLYVNDFSLDLGEQGVKAIQVMGSMLQNDPNFDPETLFIPKR